MAQDHKTQARSTSHLSHHSSSSEEIPFHLDLQKIRRGILRHIPLILLFGFLFALIGGYFSYRLLHTYKAQAVLIYQERIPRPFEQEYQVLRLTMPSAIEMITLPGQLRTVKSILGLDLTVQELEKMISVELPIRQSNLINIVVQSENPELSIDIANTLADVAVRNARELNRRQWQAAYAYFKYQNEQLNKALQDQLRFIAEFRKEHRFIGADITGLTSGTNVRHAEEKLQNATLEYKQLLVEYENLSREYGKIPEQIERPIVESTLRDRIAQLELLLLDAKSRYAQENPKIKSLEYQLAELEKRAQEEIASKGAMSYEPNPLKERLTLDLINLQAKLSSTLKLQEELEEIVRMAEERATSLTDEQVRYADLLNRKETIETNIKANESMQRSIDTILHLGKGDLELYQPAEASRAENGSLFADLLPTFGFILGAFLGILAAAFLELFDRKIRTASQVESSYHVPCLVTIPESNRIKRENGMLQYIRSLAEKITLQKSTFHSLVITSSIDHEGKSLIAVQLAKYYTHLGKHVALVEFDGQPSHRGDHPTEQKRIEDFLRGKCSVEDLIQKNEFDRLSAGPDPHLKELMKKEALNHLWGHLNHYYEIIIIDAPGIFSQEYAVNLASFADCCVYVIGSNKVKKNYIDAGIEELKVYGIQPLGIVLNRVKSLYVDDLQLKSQKKSNQKRSESRVLQALRQQN